MTLSIAVMQRKGGAGKTTLTVHLSVALAMQGKNVVLCDADSQGSLRAWHAVRTQRQRTPALECIASGAGRISVDVRSASRYADVVVSDHPPHADTAAGPAIRTADIVVIPCQPSLPDIMALPDIVQAVERERKNYLVVFNRVAPQFKVDSVLSQQLINNHYHIAKTTIGNRVAFANSLFDGAGITEYAINSTAAQEIWALLPEILALQHATV